MSKAITFTDKGNGAALVFVHGFCESKEMWNDFIESLTVSNRVICLDLPGFGESLLDKESVSMEWFAEEVRRLLLQLNIASFTYIGHSLGGYVGLAYAEKYAATLSGLCLFHSTAYADSEERKSNRDKTIAFIQKYSADLFTQSFIEPLFLLQNRLALKEEIAMLKRIAKQSSGHGIIATTLAMRDRPDRTAVLASLSVPVLLIGGKNDATIPIDKLKEQARLSGHIQCAEIENCGHMGMFEQKEKTLDVIKNFIKRCSIGK
jgi:pimeloyl-ACP methyl ester carboxylesterase